jgi:hypothetical protein
MNLGGWIFCLVLGIVAVLVAPLCPPPAARIVKIIGIVLLVLALALFLFWIIGVLAGGHVAVGGLAHLAVGV